MDPLTTKRGVFRSTFTRTVNVLKTELGKEDFSEGVIRDKFTKLQKVHQDIEGINEAVLDSIISGGATKEKISEEMESWELYSDEFITISRLVSEKLDNAKEIDLGTRSQIIVSSKSNVANNTRSFKLPKIELKKFDGDLLNWLPFWSQFEKIHEDPDLHESDKFQYLLQSMEQGTRARDFIDSYPMTAKNYSKAISALKERFGNNDLLIEVYVRELIKLIVTNVKADSSQKLPLPRLFDKIEAQLRALESLDIKRESNTCWLYPMVESSLSEEVLRAWQRSPLFGEFDEENKDVSCLTNLMKFLKCEVEGEERLKLARGGFECFEQKDKCYIKFKTVN